LSSKSLRRWRRARKDSMRRCHPESFPEGRGVWPAGDSARSGIAASHQLLPVLVHSPHQIVRHAGMKRARVVGHDVGAVVKHVSGGQIPRSRSEPRMPVDTGATKDESAHAKGDSCGAWYTPSPPSPLPRAGEGRLVAYPPAVGRAWGEGEWSTRTIGEATQQATFAVMTVRAVSATGNT